MRTPARRDVIAIALGLLMGLGLPPLAAQTTDGLEEILSSRAPEAWTSITVDSTRDVGTYLSVAIEPSSGAPFISYYEGVAQDLWFANYVGVGGPHANCGPSTSWHCQVVDSAGDVGKYNSIAVYRSCTGETSAIISYYGASNAALKVAEATCTDACPFVVSTVKSGVPGIALHGLHTAVAHSSNGVPFISYQYTATVGDEHASVASKIGSGGNCGEGSQTGMWQCDSIMSGASVGRYTSIVFDGLSRPHIAFYDAGMDYPWYAVYVGSGGNCGPSNTWLCKDSHINTHDSGQSTSLYVEPDGTPHLAFLDMTTEELVYATYVGSGGNCGFSGGTMQWEWQCDVIDDDIGLVGSGRTVAIAGDVNGNPMIAYQDASDDIVAPSLWFAQPYHAAPSGAVPNCGPYVAPFFTWVCTKLDGGGGERDEGDAVAIASNATGVAIAYHELDTYEVPVEGNLKLKWDAFLIFADGFESGDWSRWSSAQP